ncbi:MAG: hypothetical protein KC442_12835 [Thermomicrobiales bacterium]|nr:hypothetical protein [Thermomicrobiales bacterium]
MPFIALSRLRSPRNASRAVAAGVRQTLCALVVLLCSLALTPAGLPVGTGVAAAAPDVTLAQPEVTVAAPEVMFTPSCQAILLVAATISGLKAEQAYTLHGVVFGVDQAGTEHPVSALRAADVAAYATPLTFVLTETVPVADLVAAPSATAWNNALLSIIELRAHVWLWESPRPQLVGHWESPPRDLSSLPVPGRQPGQRLRPLDLMLPPHQPGLALPDNRHPLRLAGPCP